MPVVGDSELKKTKVQVTILQQMLWKCSSVNLRTGTTVTVRATRASGVIGETR